MDQESGRAFGGTMNLVTEPGWVEFAGGLTVISRRRGVTDAKAEQAGDDDADYYRARAEVEARRAEEATHPAARDAHLELAGLYHQRALAALQDEDSAVLDWMSEGGSWLVAA